MLTLAVTCTGATSWLDVFQPCVSYVCLIECTGCSQSELVIGSFTAKQVAAVPASVAFVLAYLGARFWADAYQYYGHRVDRAPPLKVRSIVSCTHDARPPSRASA